MNLAFLAHATGLTQAIDGLHPTGAFEAIPYPSRQRGAWGLMTTLARCGVGIFILLKFVDTILPLRVTEEQETEGFDLVLHEELGYDL